MGKKKQNSKMNAPAERKSILDSLKFMQISKDAVTDKKHKYKRREEETHSDFTDKKQINIDETVPMFFKKVQELAKKKKETIENKVEMNEEIFERINL